MKIIYELPKNMFVISLTSLKSACGIWEKVDLMQKVNAAMLLDRSWTAAGVNVLI